MTTITARSARSLQEVAVVVAGSGLLIASFLGPSWLQMPADPATNTPSTSMSFQDLSTATVSSPSSIQAAYFGWLAWVLVAGLIMLSVTILLTAHRTLATVTTIASIVVYAITIMALKGPLTWSQTVDTLPDVRLGGYLMLTGLLALLLHSLYKTTPAGQHRSSDFMSPIVNSRQAPS
jgi:hypothetical protein